MSIVSSIFQKQISQLTLDDIVTFFSEEREETATLEFKSGELEKEKLYREVCAFINTEGGVIIYGSPREKLTGKIKTCQGLPIACTKVKSQESLISSIVSNISPAPIGISAKQIQYNDGLIFIIEVPQSITPPHQVNDEGKYYIRLDKEARAAPHGIVEAFFNKRQKPKLTISVKARKTTESKLELQIKLENISDVTAESIGLNHMIYGVSTMEETESDQYTIKLDRKKCTCLIVNKPTIPILVRRIYYNIRLNIEPIKINSIILECLAWCKDGNALFKVYKINRLTMTVLELYNSEEGGKKPDSKGYLSKYQAFIEKIS